MLPGVNFINVFKCSFYAHRAQKCKKDSQLKQLFTLLVSVSIKAALKHVDEIDHKRSTWWELELDVNTFLSECYRK